MASDDAHNDDFYVRYYVGHRGKFGHEFMEFELCPSGKLRYANNSNYKDDTMIRKEVCVSPAVAEEVRRIIASSDVESIEDTAWSYPSPGARRQELEIKVGKLHIAYTTAEIVSPADIRSSPDPVGLATFYYLTQDLKSLILSLFNLHFKVEPFSRP